MTAPGQPARDARRPRTARASVVALFALVLAACSGGSAPTPVASGAEPTVAVTAESTAASSEPSATAEPSASADPSAAPSDSGDSTAGRTGRVEVPPYFVITLADGWVEVPLDAAQIQTILDNLPEDADIDAMIEAQLPALLAAGVKLWAFDLAGAEAGSNLNVIVQPGSIPASLLAQIAEASLGQVPGLEGEPSVSDAVVDGTDGIRVDYRLSQTGPSGVRTVNGTQIYVSGPTNLLIVTFTTAADDDTAQAEVDGMIESIDLLD